MGGLLNHICLELIDVELRLVLERLRDQKPFESSDRANDLLRYGISVLKGTSGMVSSEKGKLQVALILKKDLARMGAWWQVMVLEHWIHRFQRGDFSP